MKNIIKAYVFEIKRFVFNKRFCVIIIFAFVIIMFGLMVLSKDLYLENSATDTEVAFSDYARLRDTNKLYYDLICGNEVDLPEGKILVPYNEIDKEHYHQQYLKYDYLLSTKTLERDYVKSDIESSVRGHEDAVSMLKLAEYSFYVLLLFSIIMPLLSISVEFDKGTIKNLLASPIKRKDLLIGKMLFTLSCLLIVFITVFILGIVINNGSNDKILVFTGNQIKAVNCKVFFAAKMTGQFFLMILASATSLFFAEKTKKAFLGAFSFISFYLLSLGSFIITYNALNGARPKNKNTLRQFFPIINIQTQQGYFFTRSYWIMLICCTVGIVLLIVFSWRSLRKRDVE